MQESEYDRAVRQFFTQIAGDNLEVDWRELKEVLDYALKKGSSSRSPIACYSGFPSSVDIYREGPDFDHMTGRLMPIRGRQMQDVFKFYIEYDWIFT